MEKLGIDPLLIAVQIINFILLLIILKKVLYKPVLDTIKKRRESIEQIEKDKVDLEKAKTDLENKENEILAGAQREKRELILSAKREAET